MKCGTFTGDARLGSAVSFAPLSSAPAFVAIPAAGMPSVSCAHICVEVRQRAGTAVNSRCAAARVVALNAGSEVQLLGDRMRAGAAAEKSRAQPCCPTSTTTGRAPVHLRPSNQSDRGREFMRLCVRLPLPLLGRGLLSTPGKQDGVRMAYAPKTRC